MKYQEDESIKLEFKAEMPKNDQIIKTIIGFCNQHGGRLVLGVDNDGTIIGLSENAVIETMEYLDHAIYSATSPPIIPKVYSQRIMDKLLLVIEVSEGKNWSQHRSCHKRHD
jgi:ATP-dependent DNA helicase RecG